MHARLPGACSTSSCTATFASAAVTSAMSGPMRSVVLRMSRGLVVAFGASRSQLCGPTRAASAGWAGRVAVGLLECGAGRELAPGAPRLA